MNKRIAKWLRGIADNLDPDLRECLSHWHKVVLCQSHEILEKAEKIGAMKEEVARVRGDLYAMTDAQLGLVERMKVIEEEERLARFQCARLRAENRMLEAELESVKKSNRRKE